MHCGAGCPSRGPSLSSAAGPERINESFVMGDTGCQMNIVLDGGTGAIVSADLGPAFEPPAPPPTVYTFNFAEPLIQLCLKVDPYPRDRFKYSIHRDINLRPFHFCRGREPTTYS